MEINTIIGRSIKIACYKAGITQTELAARMNTSPQLVSVWVNGGPISHRKLERVVETLGYEKFSEFVALGE